MQFKTCRKCGETRPTSEFYRHSGSGDGLQSYCKECSVEYTHTWREANGERDSAKSRVRHAAHRFARAANFANRRTSGVLTKETLLKIYEHQSHQCFYCKGDLDEIGWHLDHLVPVSKGGTNDPANIVLACRRCNNAKNDSTAQEYLDWLAGVVARWPELYKKLA